LSGVRFYFCTIFSRRARGHLSFFFFLFFFPRRIPFFVDPDCPPITGACLDFAQPCSRLGEEHPSLSFFPPSPSSLPSVVCPLACFISSLPPPTPPPPPPPHPPTPPLCRGLLLLQGPPFVFFDLLDFKVPYLRGDVPSRLLCDSSGLSRLRMPGSFFFSSRCRALRTDLAALVFLCPS